MKSWKRITLVSFVLIGSVTSFSYWSISQFDQAFDNLSTSYLANTHSASPSFNFKQNTELASTSPEISEEIATSTDPELSFTFPQKDTDIYIGCTYPISWQSSTTISSLDVVLIDAGTSNVSGPIASGLARENIIAKDLQNLNWKVGNVWPGTYYIKVSKINDVEAEFKSKVFEINKMPKGLDEKEKNNICREFSD